MDFVELIYKGNSYNCTNATSLEMEIIGNFLTADVGYCGSSFREWALDKSDLNTNSNVSYCRKKNNIIFIGDLYSIEKVPTEITIDLKNFLHLLEIWERTICKVFPSKVIIKKDKNSHLVIEMQ
jgi:hypothetical protein